MQLLSLFIFFYSYYYYYYYYYYLLLLKQRFLKETAIPLKKFSIREGKNSRSVERSNTNPDVSKAEIKKK